MKRLNSFICVIAGYLIVAFMSSSALPAQELRPDSCHPTKPNGIVAGSSERNEGSYGNALLSVGPFGLWPNGTVIFKPGGAGFQTQDGALGMKFGWTRGIRGKLNVTGHRIDGDAPPVRFETGTPNSENGFLASYLIFPTPGCWEVTAQIDDRADSRITFVTRVEKIGDGPQWRR
jgi:hypothetical protein